MDNKQIVCSFCGQPKEKVVCGNDGAICTECASLLKKIIEENKEVVTETKIDDVLTPKEMKKFLDQYVIGQDKAKQKVCVAVYNHYKRLHSKLITDDVDIEKSNVIIVGPTGTGKCVTGDTIVTIRNKKTNEVENILVNDFIGKYCNQTKK